MSIRAWCSSNFFFFYPSIKMKPISHKSVKQSLLHQRSNHMHQTYFKYFTQLDHIIIICLLGCCTYHTFSNINVVGKKKKKKDHTTFERLKTTAKNATMFQCTCIYIHIMLTYTNNNIHL